MVLFEVYELGDINEYTYITLKLHLKICPQPKIFIKQGQ